jgi:hypothetical protein
VNTLSLLVARPSVTDVNGQTFIEVYPLQSSEEERAVSGSWPVAKAPYSPLGLSILRLADLSAHNLPVLPEIIRAHFIQIPRPRIREPAQIPLPLAVLTRTGLDVFPI